MFLKEIFYEFEIKILIYRKKYGKTKRNVYNYPIINFSNCNSYRNFGWKLVIMD